MRLVAQITVNGLQSQKTSDPVVAAAVYRKVSIHVPNSGKLLIFAMLVVGVLAAGASWWFRYSATHRAVRFWGPEGARLIRDAPIVEFYTLKRTNDDPESVLIDTDADSGLRDLMADGDVWQVARRRDVSTAPGITHLRNALLEDRSFDWSMTEPPPEIEWATVLQFRSRETQSMGALMFSPDFQWVLASNSNDKGTVSCRPIAAGVSEFFGDVMDEAENAPSGDER